MDADAVITIIITIVSILFSAYLAYLNYGSDKRPWEEISNGFFFKKLYECCSSIDSISYELSLRNNYAFVDSNILDLKGSVDEMYDTLYSISKLGISIPPRYVRRFYCSIKNLDRILAYDVCKNPKNRPNIEKRLELIRCTYPPLRSIESKMIFVKKVYFIYYLLHFRYIGNWVAIIYTFIFLGLAALVIWVTLLGSNPDTIFSDMFMAVLLITYSAMYIYIYFWGSKISRKKFRRYKNMKTL